MKRSKRPTHRCRECGVKLWDPGVVAGDGYPPLCGEHPSAERVPWTWGMVRSLHYIAAAHLERTDVDAFVETYRDDMFPGVTRGDMAMAAVLFKDWVVEKDLLTREGYYRELREPVTPKGLYG